MTDGKAIGQCAHCKNNIFKDDPIFLTKDGKKCCRKKCQLRYDIPVERRVCTDVIQENRPSGGW